MASSSAATLARLASSAALPPALLAGHLASAADAAGVHAARARRPPSAPASALAWPSIARSSAWNSVGAVAVCASASFLASSASSNCGSFDFLSCSSVTSASFICSSVAH